MTKPEELTAYIFDGQPHLLSSLVMGWMDASPRFTTFVETYRDKIRKKLRVTKEPESILDVSSELATAYRLLTDRRLAVEYEPYASAQKRSPDFAVSYRVNLIFNIEVARLRVEKDRTGQIDFSHTDQRLTRILMGKLGQMQPGMPNLLAIHTQAELARSINLDTLLQAVKLRSELGEPALFAASPYTGKADFFKDFIHLSGIVLWANSPLSQVWVNKQARPGLPENVVHLIHSLCTS